VPDDEVDQTTARFLQLVTQRLDCPGDVQSVVVGHILPDLPDYLVALDSLFPISLVVAIPYSVHADTLETLDRRYTMAGPTLRQLEDPTYLVNCLADSRWTRNRHIVFDIGGYFAKALRELAQRGPVIAAIEDTEGGHRRYHSLAPQFPVPVGSVARSSLKLAEDFRVGRSCLRSAEGILHEAGMTLEKRRIVVLGYGRVGRGVAYALRSRGHKALVYDSSPLRLVLAKGEGFEVLESAEGIQGTEAVFGATGSQSLSVEQLCTLAPGCILLSCSSRDVEFPVGALADIWEAAALTPSLVAYRRGEGDLLVANGGHPVNFGRLGTMVGNSIHLVRAEILTLASRLISAPPTSQIVELDSNKRAELARLWLAHFGREE